MHDIHTCSNARKDKCVTEGPLWLLLQAFPSSAAPSQTVQLSRAGMIYLSLAGSICHDLSA